VLQLEDITHQITEASHLLMESGDNTNNTIIELIDKSKLVKELSGKLVLNESRERDLSAKIEGKKAEGVLIKQSIGKLWGKVGRIFAVGGESRIESIGEEFYNKKIGGSGGGEVGMVRAEQLKHKSFVQSNDFVLKLQTPARCKGVLERGFLDSPDVNLNLEGIKYVFWLEKGK
jgi:hypothetical protein